MKKSSIIILFFIVIIIGIAVILMPNSTEKELASKCFMYVEQYGETFPTDIEIVKDINNDVETFLDKKLYQKTFIFSGFLTRSIEQSKNQGNFLSFFNANYEDGYNELIFIKLKALAVLGEKEEYVSLFDETYEDISLSILSAMNYYRVWENEKEYVLAHDSEMFEIITSGFDTVLARCNTDTEKCRVLTDMSTFFTKTGLTNEASNATEQVQNIVKVGNAKALSDALNNWNGFE